MPSPKMPLIFSGCASCQSVLNIVESHVHAYRVHPMLIVKLLHYRHQNPTTEELEKIFQCIAEALNGK